MYVAGQLVILSPELRTSSLIAPGMAVAVSGIRRTDGAIIATRLDPAATDRLFLRGLARRAPTGTTYIGQLEIRSAHIGEALLDVEGHFAQGRLVADTIRPTVTLTDPSALFGAKVSRVIAESYVRRTGDQLELGAGVAVRLSPELLETMDGAARIAVVTLDLQADGTMTATDVALRSNGRGEPQGPHAPAERGHGPSQGSSMGPGANNGTNGHAGGQSGGQAGGRP
jgi:hypothetical protein